MSTCSLSTWVRKRFPLFFEGTRAAKEKGHIKESFSAWAASRCEFLPDTFLMEEGYRHAIEILKRADNLYDVAHMIEILEEHLK